MSASRTARITVGAVALTLALVTAGIAAGGAEGDPRGVFPRRARLAGAETAAAVRASLPAAVLAESRADLADLRIIDESGRFVPFALVAAPEPGASAAIARSAPVTLTAVDRASDDDGRPRRERLELAVEPAGFAYDRITFDLARGDLLVARATVWELADGGLGRELARNAPLFRLPGRDGARGLAAHGASIPVPLGEWPRVAIEVRIEQGGWVAPLEVRAERDDRAEQATGEVPLEVVAVRSDERSTVLDVTRPAGVVPLSLRIESSTPSFLRDVRVRDVSGAKLGRGVIAQAADGKLVADTVELERRPVASGDLYVDVDDAGEGALEDVRVTATVALPTLVLVPPPAAAAYVYWGGGRITIPSHRDLASVAQLAALAATPTAAGAAPWWQALATVAVGPPEGNPRHHGEQAMAFAERPGAALEVRGWPLARELVVGPTPEGLAEWTLDAGDVAAARPDLGDVRVVDEHDRQIAYLVDDSTTQAVEPSVASLAAAGRASRWQLTLPDGAAPLRAVTIDFTEGFVARRARILAGPHASDAVLADTRLERRVGGAPFRIALDRSPRLASVVVEIENGDDPPLTPSTSRIDVERRRLLFPAPPGRYRALLGNPSAQPPHYELASVRELALGLATGAAEPGPRGPNPAYRRPAPWTGRQAGTVVLWATLALAVAVLVALTLKLVREPPSRV